MSHDSPDNSEISRQHIATCLAVLNSIVDNPELCVQPNSPYDEVYRIATRLTKAVKKTLRKEQHNRDRSLISETGIRSDRETLRLLSQNRSLTEITSAIKEDRIPQQLAKPQRCYTCKSSFTELDQHYDALCRSCARLNFSKRTQSANLRGMTSVVTGGRVKIGFRIALNLLRAGSNVIATTRFPIDAAMRYSREDDFDEWSDRLTIFGVDFRHLADLDGFINSVKSSYRNIDIIINNSAQTIRRPPSFYEHVWKAERETLAKMSDSVRALIAGPFLVTAETTNLGDSHTTVRMADVAASISRSSSALSHTPLLCEQHRSADFPAGQLDEHGQQVDLRSHNSWIAKVGDVSFSELVEVHAVNTFAPFYLLQGLDELLMRRQDQNRFVVNVSAMEGRFDHFKDGRHPHTNMAKASLNMLTRTCADDYASRRVFMNSVDTGWVTNEFPYSKVTQMQSEGFEPPLDEIDGAARVCDPIFSALNGELPVYGKFLKDYRSVTW